MDSEDLPPLDLSNPGKLTEEFGWETTDSEL